MVSYLGSGLGKILIIHLQRDDLLLENIEMELKKNHIENAVITSAIGSLQSAVFHRVTGMGKEPEDEFITLKTPLELASLQGLVINGEAHFHMVVSDTECAYSGHLECGTKVLYLAEISLLEIPRMGLERKKDINHIAVLNKITEDNQ